VRENDQDPDGYANRAAVFLALRDFQASIRDCELALSISKNTHTGAAMNLYSALRASGNIDTAISRTWEILGLEPRRLSVEPRREEFGEVVVACVKWGEKYSWEYVNILFSSVSEHWQGPEFQFICFSDSEPLDSCLHPAINVRPIIKNRQKFFWGKASLFTDDAGIDGKLVLYLDLDTVVLGNLWILTQSFLTADAQYAVSVMPAFGLFNERGLKAKDALNTSIMIFRMSPSFRNISEAATTKVREYVHRFDHWMEMIAGDLAHRVESKYFVDFRVWKSGTSDLPAGCLLLAFPGNLKPHQVVYECPLVMKNWGRFML
jgi:tetratricopeptide (TPR) repeat protein